jgi:hypothetical protein
MKKIYRLVIFALISKSAIAQNVEHTNYKGAFAPAPTRAWTDKWTNWDPQNADYNKTNKTVVSVTDNITSNTTWSADKIYLLTSQIYVKNNATLTIEPGTVIYGDKSFAGASLIITRGAKIMAEGTADAPIVFTSNQAAGQRTSGDWGGLILLGNAKNNIVGGFGNIEGITPTDDTKHGGSDDTDNSGSLKYVRVEFAGYPLQPNKEINGITFGSVGNGTKIDYVQVSFSNDDSFEWFGGAVNCKHIVAYRGLDDDFDTDNGFSGTVQFGLGVRDPQIADNPSVSTSEGFESDNDAAGDANVPLTSATFTNMTLVGPLRGDINATVATGYRRAARIRRNSNLKVTNSIMIDFLTGLHVDGVACETNATGGTLQFKGNILAGYKPGKVGETTAGKDVNNNPIPSTFDIKKFIGDNNDTTHSTSSANILMKPYDFLNPDFRPFSTKGNDIVTTNYRGAFEPFPATPWTDKWTNWDPQNADYNKTNKTVVSITDNITTNTTWTADKIYLLTSQIYVKNNATLTIEPGTVIYGDKSFAGASLIITRGAKIMAEGTADAPIVFTSNQAAGQRTSGDWGGLILLGNAKNNIVGGFGNIEGITPTDDTKHGGSDDADNSGSLKYVRVEFAGYPLQPNKEINGITFGSVGNGTKIDYVQVSFSNDDSFEWFGGSVNCKHIVAYRGLDDDFDTDNGFSGLVQFGLGVRDPQIADNPSVSTSEGFESDNDAAGDANNPQTSAQFTNMTLVGPLRGDINATVATGYRRAARLRRNTALKIDNSIMIDFLTGLHVDGVACEGNANAGTLRFERNTLAGYKPGKVGETTAGKDVNNNPIPSTFDVKKFIGDNMNDTLTSSKNILMRPYDFLNPDYRLYDSLGLTASVDMVAENVKSMNLYPNPTSEKTKLELDLNAHSAVKVEVYSIAGQLMNTAFDGNLEGGSHLITISTVGLENGTYFVRVHSNNTSKTIKLAVAN